MAMLTGLATSKTTGKGSRAVLYTRVLPGSRRLKHDG